MMKKYVKPAVVAQDRPSGLIPLAAGLSAAGAFAVGAAAGLAAGDRDRIAGHTSKLHLQPILS